jgi:predicted AlkP superfamily phosphohydrolase/phosphomutase
MPTSNHKRPSRLLILGLDGTTFDLIKPWAEAGHLPNMARLMAQGSHAPLESTLPPVTSPAWPTFMTGKNPGKHSVFDFIQPRAGDFGLVNATHIKGQTIWDILSEAGLRVGVINVPVTYPPRPINGFMVTGLLSPQRGEISYPPDLLDRYRDELGPYRVAPAIQYRPGAEDPFIEDLNALIDTRGRYAVRLMQDQPWDCLMVHFISLDVMQHALWRFMDESHPQYDPAEAKRYGTAIRDAYARVDGYVGQMVEYAEREGAAVVVMSDHGFGPLHWYANLNLLLLDAGLMHLKSDLVTRLKAFAFRRGISPAGVYRFLARFGLHNLATRVPKSTRNAVIGKFLSFDSVDWTRTQAYSMGHVGQIYLNLKGREPQGIVDPGPEADAVLERVEEVLGTLRHPETGAPLLERTIRGKDTVHGPFAGQAADLHVILDGYHTIAFPLFATEGKIITRQIRGDSGCHRLHGILIASGTGMRAGATLDNPHIVDLAPTILHLLGQPVPSDMDGRPLLELLEDPGEVVTREVVETDLPGDQDLTPEETAEIEDRLRQLGYLG